MICVTTGVLHHSDCEANDGAAALPCNGKRVPRQLSCCGIAAANGAAALLLEDRATILCLNIGSYGPGTTLTSKAAEGAVPVTSYSIFLSLHARSSVSSDEVSETLRMIELGNMTTTDSVQQPLPFHQSLIVGLTYSLLSATLLSIYIAYILVLLQNREFRNLQAFRLMLCLGVFDFIQLIGHFVGGILTIRKEITYNSSYLCKVFGGTLNSAWVGLFPLSLVIAVNRLLIFRKAINPEGKFPQPMKIAVVLCFLYSIGFWICLLTFAEVNYHPESFSWSYSEDSNSKLMSDIEFIVSVVCIVVTFLVYITISISIYKMTRGINSIRRSERQLLVQAALLFFVLTTLITCWHYYQVFLPDTIWTLFSINIYWILYCGLNPVLHFIFSRQVRRSFQRFFFGANLSLSNKTNSVVVVTSIHQ
ncbi:hypothetical protein Y032_0116g592 [Ancylostoma ceylanicum]|uniref:G-protein coupled receptors family 1 profile domain-containing protein n=1 Tax=Ancylostoma ceylanicum TaxID=53326 RepID=A0A016TBK5_9BILA|nr:hypothetical protein Y032_0116g592 [Ancylostoma ceylanicum]